MRNLLIIFCRKRYFFRKHVILIFLLCFLYYNYPRRTKLLELYESWKVDSDVSFQRQIGSYSSGIHGLSSMIDYRNYFTKRYHLLHLPKRKRHMSFSEITSSNPDTANPLSPDFSFHLSYGKRTAKLFEDYGCGCLYRIYVLPPFSSFSDKIDSLTVDDMNGLKIVIELDNMATSYTLQEIMMSRSYPFFYPLTSRNTRPLSGMGAFTQLCYSRSAKVYYIDDNDYPPNLLNMTVECVSNELKCPVKQYSSISYIKVPLGLQDSTTSINKENVEHLKTLAKLLQDPISNGPQSDRACNLFCAPLKPNEELTLYEADKHSGIITSVLMTILHMKNEKVVQNWGDIFLTATYDGSLSPQVNVSIESMFISQGLQNDFRGAAYGRMNRNCYFGLEGQFTRYELLNVGYLYLPMPFWKSAKIRLKYSPHHLKQHHDRTKMVCYQLTESTNFYDFIHTGHLHISQVFHSDQTDKRRTVVEVAGGWGHLVGVGVEVHNLRPNLEGSLIERWAALQADPLVYVDGLNTPKVRGTGLEDYFSYAHGFAGAANTSYSFVGVPFALTSRNNGNTWICYRQHILDPISFDESLEFIMEGTHKILYTSKAENISYKSYREKIYNKETVFSYLALFYYNTHPHPSRICDKIILCDELSKSQHKFRSSQNGTLFSLESVHFIANVLSYQPSNLTCGMSFQSGSILRFRFLLPASPNPKLVLKRTFHMHPFQWNDLCRVELNNIDLGLWTFPMGPTTSKYSLRDESLEVWLPDFDKNQYGGSNHLADFRITVLSQWHDISYELCDYR